MEKKICVHNNRLKPFLKSNISLCQTCCCMIIDDPSSKPVNKKKISSIKSEFFTTYNEFISLPILLMMKKDSENLYKILKMSSFNTFYLVKRRDLLSLIYQKSLIFNYSFKTYYQAGVYLDIFFSKIFEIDIDYEIIAIVSLILAVKFVENNLMSLSVLNLTNNMNRQYDLDFIRMQEMTFLEMLDFKLNYNTPFNFLYYMTSVGYIFNDECIINREMKIASIFDKKVSRKYDNIETIYKTGFDVLEKSFSNARILEYSSLEIAASCVAMTRELYEYSDIWPSRLSKYYEIQLGNFSQCFKLVQCIYLDKHETKQIIRNIKDISITNNNSKFINKRESFVISSETGFNMKSNLMRNLSEIKESVVKKNDASMKNLKVSNGLNKNIRVINCNKKTDTIKDRTQIKIEPIVLNELTKSYCPSINRQRNLKRVIEKKNINNNSNNSNGINNSSLNNGHQSQRISKGNWLKSNSSLTGSCNLTSKEKVVTLAKLSESNIVLSTNSNSTMNNQSFTSILQSSSQKKNESGRKKNSILNRNDISLNSAVTDNKNFERSSVSKNKINAPNFNTSLSINLNFANKLKFPSFLEKTEEVKYAKETSHSKHKNRKEIVKTSTLSNRVKMTSSSKKIK